MADKIKKISVNKLDGLFRDEVSMSAVEWRGVNVFVKRRLTISEVISFVNTVVDSCTIVNDNTYTPELKSFAINACVISLYTNISLPKSSEKQYEYVCIMSEVGGLIDDIKKIIDINQYNDIIYAIDEKIRVFIDKQNSMIDAKVNDICAAFENITSQFGAMFDGVDSADVMNMVKNIGKMDISQEDMLKAITKENGAR